MVEEVNEPEANDAADVPEEEQDTRRASYEDMAARYVSRSRKSLDLRDRPGEEQSNFYLAAQVYATLELAQAIRESNSS